jgi:hypothetical protein
MICSRRHRAGAVARVLPVTAALALLLVAGSCRKNAVEPTTERSGSDGPAPAYRSGAVWYGSLGGLWDFEMTGPEMRDGLAEFRYEARPRRGGETTTGTMKVECARRKVKLTLVGPDGQTLRTHDGALSADGRFVSGAACDWPNGPTSKPIAWYASIELPAADLPARLDLNSASVGQLHRVLQDKRAARLVFEYRIFNGPYRGLDDLDKVRGLDPKARATLKEVADVRQDPALRSER